MQLFQNYNFCRHTNDTSKEVIFQDSRTYKGTETLINNAMY